MTNKMPRFTNQVLLGLLALAFTVACNSKKDKETKETKMDTATVKPMDTVTTPDTMKMDTADTRPVKTPD